MDTLVVMMKCRLFPLTLLSVLLLVSCVTSQKEENPSSPAVSANIADEDKSLKTPGNEVTINNEKEPEKSEIESESPDTVEDVFVVSEEVFMKTFSDVSDLIDNLNAIIKAQDFSKWQTMLSKEYLKTISDPEELKKISDQPLLKKYDIKLNSLKDYFLYVVVPSRSNARLDDLIFVDESHIKAIMLINGQRSILYKLIKIDDAWKIGDF